MDKNKLVLPVSILLGCIVLGGFFYASQVSKQNSIEKQQEFEIQQERQDKLAEQIAKEQAAVALNTCLSDADASYSSSWHRECKSQGKLTNKCIDIVELSYSDYLEKHNLSDNEYKAQRNITDSSSIAGILDYLGRKDECSCRLPLANADRINESLESEKALCFKKYPQ